MSERDDHGRGPRAWLGARFRHPYLVVTTGVGVALLLAAGGMASFVPVLAFRLGFLGAVVALLGVTGTIAFWVNDRGSDRS